MKCLMVIFMVEHSTYRSRQSFNNFQISWARRAIRSKRKSCAQCLRMLDSIPMPPRPSLSEIFLVALRLGCTCFGGPVAHLAHFRKEYVERRRWLDEAHYADLVALCQFLP